jgi:hypothetical protein
MTDLGTCRDLVDFAVPRGAGDLDSATVRRLIGFDTDRDPLRLTERYGSSENDAGEFCPGPHRFDINMQDCAFTRLEAWL